MGADSNFSGKAEHVQLVPGSLYGLRAFRVRKRRRYGGDSQLILASPTQDSDWTPGENVASCAFAWLIDYSDGTSGKLKHVPGNAGCSCGFYSYYRMGPAKTYYPHSDIEDYVGLMAVIEAYGRVTVGDKGMRSEKARVVGLVVPQTLFTGKIIYDEHKAILEQYSDVRVFRTLMGAANAFHINGRPKINA